MPGELAVLSTARGHLKLLFDKNDPIKVEQARRTVKQLLSQGYVIFVTLPDNQVRRVYDFDPTCDEYILADVPAAAGSSFPPSPAQEPSHASGTIDTASSDRPVQPGPTVSGTSDTAADTQPKRRHKRGERVAADSVDAQAIAPTGGG